MNKTIKNTLMISLGSGLEFYDFILYGMMANFLSKAFFPPESQSLALIKTFSLFAIAYFVRPLGGVIFGHFGDKKGRKASFNASILLMALSTVLIGLLPNYEKAGSLGACCLVFLRLLQGIAQGAELPGAITLICESCDKRQGFHSALLFSFVGLGASLAAFIVYLLNSLLTTMQMQNFGWRIPFFLGAVLAIVARKLRANAFESFEFEAAKKLDFPLKALLLEPKKLAYAISITLLAALLIVFKLYFPTLFSQYYHYRVNDIYLTLSISLVFSALIHPAVGFFSDYVDKKAMLFTSSALIALFLPLAFSYVAVPKFSHLLLFMLLYQVMIALLVVCYPPLLARLFSVQVRYSGVALSYNLSYVLASLSPALADVILHLGVKPLGIYLSISVIALMPVVMHLKGNSLFRAD
jgi:MFS transporter, MHS family, proline/betaine transporter